MKAHFLQFIVDSETRQLLSDGKEVHLSPKAFDMLCALIGRRPNIVCKEELLELIWPDSHVSEANLNVLVAEIRRALADDAQNPRCIRTAHGVGFAFCGPAAELDKEAARAATTRTRYWLVANGRSFTLTEGENVIGRDPSCQVWLDDPDVSRRHAVIRIDGADGASIADLNSTNGTLLGRMRVKTEKSLNDGDVLRIGPIELKFRDGGEAPQQTRRIRRKGV